MYGDYAFVLEWDDIDPDTQDEKIRTFITFNHEAGDYPDENGEQRPLEEVLEDESVQQDAYRSITARFPMYF